MGFQHALFLTENGEIFSSGKNTKGQLGQLQNIKDKQKILIPEKINYNGSNQDKVILISCGREFSAFVTVNGNLYVFGENNDFQLGIENIKQSEIPKKVNLPGKVIDVSLGEWHVIALLGKYNFKIIFLINFFLENGEMYAWGNNDFGQIGINSKIHQKKPIKINFKEKIKLINCGSTHSGCVTESGKLFMVKKFKFKN
jgi:X-linked retinitis pigmentosa GTPase regulator